MKLTEPQIRALKFLLRSPAGEWVYGTPVTQKCLNVLSDKELVNVAGSPEGWCERLTEKGREVAVKL